MHHQRNRLSIFKELISPILGIAIAKIVVTALKLKAIIFKLMVSVVICFLCLKH